MAWDVMRREDNDWVKKCIKYAVEGAKRHKPRVGNPFPGARDSRKFFIPVFPGMAKVNSRENRNALYDLHTAVCSL